MSRDLQPEFPGMKGFSKRNLELMRQWYLFWSAEPMQAVLTHQIESGFYQRSGKAITNFQTALPPSHSDLARQTLKDPYNFDFLMLREQHDEQELENA